MKKQDDNTAATDSTSEQTGGQTEPNAEKRPAPKRKFRVQVGNMTFEKRASVAEMVQSLNETTGTSAVLMLDGYDFTLNV